MTLVLPDVRRASDLPPLPGFADPMRILRESLDLLDPPDAQSVSQAAARHVRVPLGGAWGPFDPTVTPYMVEPTDMLISRRYEAVVLVAPAQTGKTQAILNLIAYAVINDPAPVLVVHMSRPDAQAWVEDKLNPMVRHSPTILDRLGKDRDDDALFRKRFRGMNVDIVNPDARKLSSRSPRWVMLTDFDHHPVTLGRADQPEGTTFTKGLGRVTTWQTRGTVYVESTPGFYQSDPDWAQPAAAPHMLPPADHGIVPLYNAGTRGRFYWTCPDCDTPFEPRFDRLHYDAGLSPLAAGESARMTCPHCGSLLAPSHKAELTRAGTWMHETEDGGVAPMGDAAVRHTTVASYALDGTLAAFGNWAALVAGYVEADRRAREEEDETALANWTLEKLGRPYRPRQDEDDDALTLARLKDGRIAQARGTAPDWVRFVTVSVDVQGTYFAVQITGWAPDGTRTVVDRFDLTQPPDGAPDTGDPDSPRNLQPAIYAADWAVLDPLLARRVPVGDTGWHLTPAALIVDFQGEAGVSDNAEAFWRRMRRDGEGGRVFLYRGNPRQSQGPRVKLAKPESTSGAGKVRQIRLLQVDTDRLKDSVHSALRRPLGVVAAFPLPEWMNDRELGEFLAERKTKQGWRKKPGAVRNESLDLSVFAQAWAELKGLRKIDPDNPPAWATLGTANPFAEAPEPGAQSAEAAPPSRPARAPRQSFLPKRDKFL